MTDNANETRLRDAGQTICDLRKKAGMSQEDLSFEINIDQSTLSKVERRGPHMISWAKFLALAHALDVDLEIVFHQKN